jgi:phosphoribosyl 1,2-cyclic phosphodiesterase
MTEHSMGLSIHFWGVRGSLPSPGPDTVRTGGNTSSVEVRCGATRLLLDAGTGLRGVGERWQADGGGEVHLLLSHLHWDHIQGLPFFVPLYRRDTQLTVLGPRSDRARLREALARQMSSPVFPVQLRDVPCRLSTRELSDRAEFDLGEAHIRCARTVHPGGGLAYRIDHGGRSVVYATDTEHEEDPHPPWLELARDADVLILDAQYLPEEYAQKRGFGHSTFVSATAFAQRARVGQLVLFHHDPGRTDSAVDAIERSARERFAATLAAREGTSMSLSRKEEAA